MGNSKRYATINTKVMMMQGDLLLKEDYETLLKYESVDECIDYLKTETSYRDLIESYEGEIKLESLELVFRKNIYSKLEKTKLYFLDEYREYIKALFIRYEVENIKLFLRMIVRSESIDGLSERLFKPKLKSKIDYELLENSATIESLIDNLAGTPYKRILEMYLEEPSQKMMFYMEMSLDRYYFSNLVKKISNLDKEDQILLNELLGKNIDLLNIQWIYRGKKYYSLTPEELINYTLSGGYYFRYKDLKKLSYTERLDDIVETIKSGRYGELINDGQSADIYVEVEMERYLYKLFNKMKRENTMNIVESIVFIHNLEYEMRDLFIILESKRYGVSEDVARTFLVKTI